MTLIHKIVNQLPLSILHVKYKIIKSFDDKTLKIYIR